MNSDGDDDNPVTTRDFRALNRSVKALETHANQVNTNLNALATSERNRTAEIHAVVADVSSVRDLQSPYLHMPLQFFTGEPGENFSEFLELFELHANANNYDEARKLRVLPSYLRKFALETYKSFDNAIKTNYPNLVQSLRDQLAPVGREHINSIKLAKRMQEKSESVNDFALAIKKLVYGSYPQLAEDARMQIARQFFIARLREQIREFVLQQDPDSFTRALNAAQQREAQLRLCKPIEISSEELFAAKQSEELKQLIERKH